MKKKTQRNLKFTSYLFLSIFLTLGLSISLQSILAAWTAPTATPPGDNISEPINIGSVSQTKTGGLGANGNFSVGGDSYFIGKVGIGVASPAQKLEVGGKIKITDGTQSAGRVLTSDANGLASWASESDPQVNTLSNGRWCTSDGSAVNCSSNAPVLAEVDPKVLAVTSNNWCRGTGSQVTCDQTAPLTSDIYVNVTGDSMTGALNMNYASAEINHPLDNTFFINSNEGMQLHFNYGGGTGVFGINNSTNTQVLTILNNGNVGIGVTNPGSKLVVAGEIHTSALANKIFYGAGTTYRVPYMNDSDVASAGNKITMWGTDGRIGLSALTQDTSGRVLATTPMNTDPNTMIATKGYVEGYVEAAITGTGPASWTCGVVNQVFNTTTWTAVCNCSTLGAEYKLISSSCTDYHYTEHSGWISGVNEFTCRFSVNSAANACHIQCCK